MKKQLVIVCTFVLLIGLSGCNEENPADPKSKLVGTWKMDPGVTQIFYSDGTFVTGFGQNPNTSRGTYNITDEQLVLTHLKVDGTINSVATFTYSFSNNYNTLTLYNVDAGYEYIYTRQ
jgi:hypothetical protein